MDQPVNYVTYGDVPKGSQEDEAVKDYCRQRIKAAMTILERIIGQDLEEELQREMERQETRSERRKQNLMMARRALEAIRVANGHLEERDFSLFHRDRAIYKTPYGMVMLGVQEVLEKFWTGENE